MLEKLDTLDKNLFLWLNSHHTPFFDKFMWFISGRIEWLPLYLILIGYIVYIYRWKSIAVIVAIIIAVALADQLAVKAFKEVFQRLRPSHSPDIQNIVHIVNGYRGGSYGFVSNHAANTFALATFLCCLFRNKYFIVSILLWATIVSYSRIYLGVHYPCDVLGGAILGIFIGWIVYYLYLKAEKKLYKNFTETDKTKSSII
jgi:undecaprenyl-diphosphatase